MSRTTAQPIWWSRSDLRIVVAIVSAFALGVGLLSWRLSIWLDEAYTLHSTGSGVSYAFLEAIRFEQQPPLYFMALALWRTFDQSDFFARSFSTLSVIATLFLLLRYGRKRFPRLGGPCLVAFAALNVNLIWSALELRPYGIVTTLGAALLVTFFEGYFDPRPSLRARRLFVALAVVSLYTHYYLGFEIAGCAVVVAVMRHSMWRTFVKGAAAIAVLGTPAALLALHQASQPDGIHVNSVNDLHRLLASVQTFVWPRLWIDDLANFAQLRLVLLAAAALFCVWFVAGKRPASYCETTKALTLISTTIVAFFLLLIAGHVEMYLPRHATVLLVPLIALTYAFAADLVGTNRRLVAYFFAIFAVLCVSSLLVTYHTFSKSGDWRTVAQYLAEQSNPSDEIAIFQPQNVLVLRHYYDGSGNVVPLPVEPTYDAFNVSRFGVRSASQIDPALRRLRLRWLVLSPYPCDVFNDLGCDALLEAIRLRYSIVDEKQFNGTRVFELALRSGER